MVKKATGENTQAKSDELPCSTTKGCGRAQQKQIPTPDRRKSAKEQLALLRSLRSPKDDVKLNEAKFRNEIDGERETHNAMHNDTLQSRAWDTLKKEMERKLKYKIMKTSIDTL